MANSLWNRREADRLERGDSVVGVRPSFERREVENSDLRLQLRHEPKVRQVQVLQDRWAMHTWVLQLPIEVHGVG